MGVNHDLALLNFSIFAEKTSNIVLSKTRMNAGYEKIGASIPSLITVPLIAGA